MRFVQLFYYGYLLIAIVNLGCHNTISQTTVIEPPRLGLSSDSAAQVLMPDSADQVYTGLKHKTAVIGFYKSRELRPAWSHNENLSTLRDSLIALISDIRYYGLMPASYHIDEIIAEKDNLHLSYSTPRIDALLTDAFMSIARDLRHGRMHTHVTDDDFLYISLLQSAIKGYGLKRSLETYEPAFFQYHALKKVLRYSLDSLPENMRKKVMEGYTDVSIPSHQKIRTVEINLERWRGERTALGDYYILVNIPSFTLEVVLNDTVRLTSKVIVGTFETPTPILTSNVECFTTYPYWHVPRKIAVEEYLPVIQKDVSFLKQNNFDVLNRSGVVMDPDSVPWGSFSKNYFPVLLRQREGTDNSLGIIKFTFDNPYAVYLHDTNAKRLFNYNVRAFSHGCIRMEKAVDLAHYLVTRDVKKQSKTVDTYLKQKKRHIVELKDPVPIYVRYFTAEVKNDMFYSYRDIYLLDKKLAAFLYPARAY